MLNEICGGGEERDRGWGEEGEKLTVGGEGGEEPAWYTERT